jgi:hypothetical protein
MDDIDIHPLNLRELIVLEFLVQNPLKIYFLPLV